MKRKYDEERSKVAEKKVKEAEDALKKQKVKITVNSIHRLTNLDAKTIKKYVDVTLLSCDKISTEKYDILRIENVRLKKKIIEQEVEIKKYREMRTRNDSKNYKR